MHVLALSVLISLSQTTEFLTWVDAEGVTHVGARAEAPVGATALRGEGLSVVSLDSRARGPADGGSLRVDAEWWQARWNDAKAELAAAQRRLAGIEGELRSARVPVCVTARAEAVAVAPVVLKTTPPVRVAQNSVRAVETKTSCREGNVPAGLVRERLEAAEVVSVKQRALESLREEAARQGVSWLL